MAEPADKTQQYDGVVLYVERRFFYQVVKKGYVRHDAAGLPKAPS